MSERTTLSGHIQEPNYGRKYARQTRMLQAGNWRHIRCLPREDEYPLLTRGMFAHSPKATSWDPHLTPTYQGHVLYFGGSFSSLYLDWQEWRTKFESLLRRMYWHHAVVVVVSEAAGTHLYKWEATSTAIEQFWLDPPLPVTEWTVETTPNPL